MPTDDVPTSLPRLRPTPRYRDVLRRAEDQARRHGHRHLGVEHLMLGILDGGRSVATLVLQKFVDLPTLRHELERILASEGPGQSTRPTSEPWHGEDDIASSGTVPVTLVRADERQPAVIDWAWRARSSPGHP